MIICSECLSKNLDKLGFGDDFVEFICEDCGYTFRIYDEEETGYKVPRD